MMRRVIAASQEVTGLVKYHSYGHDLNAYIGLARQNDVNSSATEAATDDTDFTHLHWEIHVVVL
jgi:hypothetical protein